MLQKIRRSGTPFFDTYHIYDSEKRHYIGILEDHCRGVKSRYFVAWHFEGGIYYPGKAQPGKTKYFEDEDAALDYIVKGA